MTPWTSLSFASPWAFALFALMPLIYWLYSKQKPSQSAIALAGVEGWSHQPSFKERILRYLPILYFVIAGLLIIAMAKPQKIWAAHQIKGEGLDIALSIDLSSSMLAQDFRPNRLAVCKELAADFVAKREFDRFALVVFAAESYTQCPLTTDHQVITQMLSDLDVGYLEDGTAIGMGLATAVNRLKDSPVKSKIIILLTDGVNNAGYIQPEEAIALAKDNNIKVYTIAVGSEGKALTPVGRSPNGEYRFDYDQVRIDEVLLKKIAAATGGQEFRARTAADLKAVYAEIDRLEKSTVILDTIKRHEEAYFPFLWAALALLLLDLLIRFVWIKPISQ